MQTDSSLEKNNKRDKITDQALLKMAFGEITKSPTDF